MYSPKIRDDLIPEIYHAAREAGVYMTTWVNQVISQALPQSAKVGSEGAIDSKEQLTSTKEDQP